MKQRLLVAGAAIVAAAASAVPLHAQGSSVFTHSACMAGRNGAGVANPCADGSAVFYNPAALALQPSVLGVSNTWIFTDSEFIFDQETQPTIDRDASVTPVPAAFFQHRFSDRLAAGIGVWAPYGLGIEWDPEFAGRFVGYDNNLRGVYIQPTVAYQVAPSISVGAGVDFVRGSIDISRRADLSSVALRDPATGAVRLNPFTGQPLTFANLGVPTGTDFADASLEGSGWGVGGHVGLLARFGDRFSIGARYMSGVDIDLEGDAGFDKVETGLRLAANNPLGLPAGTPVDALVAGQFEEGGLLADRPVATALEFPAQAVIGISVRPFPALALMADYQWTGWSTFDALDIDFGTEAADSLLDDVLELGYNDANTFRLGAEFSASERLVARAGFGYNDAATPIATPLLPEGERNYYTAGLGWLVTDRLGLDLMYQFVDQQDRRGRVLPGGSTEADQAGLFTSEAQLFGVTLFYRLGSMAW